MTRPSIVRNMHLHDLEFLQSYDQRLFLFDVMHTIADFLTPEGLVSLQQHQDWLTENMDRYFSITNT